MFFFKLFLILIAIFTLGVLIVKFCKSCPVKQATAICKDSVKNFFGELLTALFEDAPVQEQFYPVLVGWDGCRVLPQLVDSEFSTVREDFASCYCTNIVLTEDNAFVIYQFSIMDWMMTRWGSLSRNRRRKSWQTLCVSTTATYRQNR